MLVCISSREKGSAEETAGEWGLEWKLKSTETACG